MGAMKEQDSRLQSTHLVEIFNRIWSNMENDPNETQRRIMQELTSVRWRKIQKEVVDKFGSFKGVRVVEVGAGRGDISLCFSLKGAHVLLIDQSRAALKIAKRVFEQFGQEAQFISADVFNLPKKLRNRFDIAVSFGFAEHFTGTSRKEVFMIHHDLVRKGGLSIISVPNAHCLPYTVHRKIAMWLHRWKFGVEVPFTPLELKVIGSSAGFNSCKIIGSSFVKDFNDFLIHIIIPSFSGNFETASFLDDWFGYALVFLGHK